MAETSAGWTERDAKRGSDRAVASRARDGAGARPSLSTIATLEGPEERDLFSSGGADLDETGSGQVLRGAVNDLQHRLLLLDAKTDVYALALGRLMTAAGADRVCAFTNAHCPDGREGYVLHAQASASPELALDGDAAVACAAYEDFAPGLSELLARGEAYGGRSEFLPGRTSARMAAQGVEATLLLPLFVGGHYHGFLRLDRCDRTKLWSEGETLVLVSAAGSISAAIERQQVLAQLVQRSHEMSALLTTSRAITSSIDYDVVLQEVAGAAAEALASAGCIIWEYSGRSDVATYRTFYERAPRSGAAERLLGTIYYASDYPGGMHAVRQGVVVQQRLSDADLSAADRERMSARGEKAWLSVPLVYREDVLGMMILTETEAERSFTPDEVRMAKVIAEQAAASLHNARLHRREEDQHRWLAALAEATRVIASRLNRDEVLRDVASLATGALLVDQTSVYEWDAGRGAFVLRAGGENQEEDPLLVLAAAEQGIDDATGERLRAGELVVQSRRDGTLPGATTMRLEAPGEQTVVWVPIRMEEETLGAMRLSDGSPQRRFGDGELSFARALCEHAAIAMNNARLYARIEDQATRDGLTGLANHRHFYDRLAEEIDRGRRYGTPVALLMLDIDDFKRLNDTYGHPAGDEVLRRLGELLAEDLRRGGDLAARYGGEEFCVILPNTAARQMQGAAPDTAGGAARAAMPGHGEGAAALAERLRQRIAGCRFPVGADGAPVKVTVSIGVASFPAAATEMDQLVARADAALYAAKRAGKDRVDVA